MRAKLHLAAFDPMHEVPRVCGVCGKVPPVFDYEFSTYGENGELTDTQGFCCSACATDLLKKLERAEAKEWAEEESALRADDVDVTALHQQRLSSFRTAR